MVASVTSRLRMFPAAEAPPGRLPELLEDGGPNALENLEQLDSLYETGDLGELQLFLEAGEDDRELVEMSLADLEQQFVDRGGKPWPGTTDFVELDWPQRTVIIRWQQGTPLLLVLGAVLVGAVAALVAAFPAPVVAALRFIGVDVSPEAVATVAGAIALIAGIIALGSLSFLGLSIPLTLLIGGGIAVFTLLRPDLAFRAFNWIASQIEEAFGVNVPFILSGVGVGVGGLVLSRFAGGTTGLVLTLGGLAAGGTLVFLGIRGVGRQQDTDTPPPPPPIEPGRLLALDEPGLAVEIE